MNLISSTRILFSVVLLSSLSNIIGQEGKVIPSVGQKTSFDSVKIGAQWWMSSNADWYPEEHRITDGSTDEPRYYINNSQVFYNWGAAQYLCPSGWNLPSEWDWEKLEYYITQQQGGDVGKHLKGINNWIQGTSANANTYGFNAGGFGFINPDSDNNPIRQDETCGFWLKDECSPDSASLRGLLWNSHQAIHSCSYKKRGYSVRCIKELTEPDTVFNLNFDNYSAGNTFSLTEVQGLYQEPTIYAKNDWILWASLFEERNEVLAKTGDGTDKYLRVHCPEGLIGGNAGINFSLLLPPGNEYILSYDVLFEGGYEFRKGGKLPGLGSIPAGNQLDMSSYDKLEFTYTGGKFPETPSDWEGFSARYQWNLWDYENIDEIPFLSTYLYYPGKANSKYGENTTMSKKTGDLTKLLDDIWHNIKMYIKLNTYNLKEKCFNSDGILKIWLDDELVYNKRTMFWRNKEWVKINCLLFNAFHGGSGTEYTPTVNTNHICFDNIYVIAPDEEPETTDPETDLTNGQPESDFGSGRHTNEVTKVNNWRWSEKYYGYLNIDGILEIEDQCENSHIYTYGPSTGATVEYRMEIGGQYSQLVLRGIADQPAPVEMKIYVDGQLKAVAEWNDGDLCNDLAFVTIDNVPFGEHIIAVQFTNDYYIEGVLDRNFYLDALMVIANSDKGIPLFAGDNIQAAVSSNPIGAPFIIKATDRDGIANPHRMQQVIPRKKNSFTGEEGAILSGAMKLENWTQEGDYWVHEGPESVYSEVYYYPKDKFSGDYRMSHFPEDLFKDNDFCKQVKSKDDLTEIGSGKYTTWYFDRDTRTAETGIYDGLGSKKIYVKGNPSGYNWELSVTNFAFGAERFIPPTWTLALHTYPSTIEETIPDSITIKNLTVEKYANPGQFGAIGFQDPGDGWVIENCDIKLNHGAGLIVGPNAVVRNNHIHNNGLTGLKASRNINPDIENILVEDNLIEYNGKEQIGYNYLWEGGGTKFTKTNGLVVRNNTVLNNRGPGLWTDIDNVNTIYEGNYVRDNLVNGIYHEISYDAVIRNNTVTNNGGGLSKDFNSYGNKFYHAQIMVSTSENVEVYNNQINAGTDNNGIMVLRENRGDYESKHVYIHHNQVTIPDGNSYGFSGAWTNVFQYSLDWAPSVLSATGHHFDYNTYFTSDIESPHWIWEDGEDNDEFWNFKGFQEKKQELNGRTPASNRGSLAMYFNDGSANAITELIHPVVFEDISKIDFTWAQGTPSTKIGSRISGQENNFSARYMGTISVDVTDNYYFRVIADDGIRFWLTGSGDNEEYLYCENWEDNQSANDTTVSSAVYLESGKLYPYRLEYFHRSDASIKDANLKLEWLKGEKGSGSWAVVPETAFGKPLEIPMNGLIGEYYEEPGDMATENIKLVRTDQQINFNWDYYAPHTEMEDDGDFAVVWKGKVKPLYNGDYYFFVRYNGNIESMNFWIDQDYTMETYHRYRVKNLVAGRLYDIKIEYRKVSNEQASEHVMLEWESLDKKQNFQLVPPYCLYPPDFSIYPEELYLEETAYGVRIKYFNMTPNSLGPQLWTGWPGENAYPHDDYFFYYYPGYFGDAVEKPVETKAQNVNFNWREGSPDYRIGSDYFTSYITGLIGIPYGEPTTTKEFLLDVDDGGIFTIPGSDPIDTWTDKNAPNTGIITLEQNTTYQFILKHYERGGGASANAILKWKNVDLMKNTGNDFEVVPPDVFKLPGADNPIIESVWLIEDTSLVGEFNDGAVLELSDLSDSLDILVAPYPDDLPKVVFVLDSVEIRTVESAPYLLVGDGSEVMNWPPGAGEHTLRIIPYTISDEEGISRTIRFVVNEQINRDAYGSENNHFTVFPNPARNELSISIPDGSTENVCVSVISIVGKVYIEKECNNYGSMVLNISNFPSGIYLVRLKSGAWSYTKKMVVY